MVKENIRTKTLLSFISRGYFLDKRGTLFNKRGEKIKAHLDRGGYWRVSTRIRDNDFKGVRPVLLHRLQAYQKFGEVIFEDNICVRHLNGDSSDNSWENIAIGTNRDNMADVDKNYRLKRAIDASSKIRSFSDTKMVEILSFYHKTKSYKKTMEKFGISSKGTLNYMINTKYQTKAS